MTVICDDCPMCNVSGKLGELRHCNMGYEVKAILIKRISTWRLNKRSVDFFEYGLCSDSCRLVKIITQDGEIVPVEFHQ